MDVDLGAGRGGKVAGRQAGRHCFLGPRGSQGWDL